MSIPKNRHPNAFYRRLQDVKAFRAMLLKSVDERGPGNCHLTGSTPLGKEKDLLRSGPSGSD